MSADRLDVTTRLKTLITGKTLWLNRQNVPRSGNLSTRSTSCLHRIGWTVSGSIKMTGGSWSSGLRMRMRYRSSLSLTLLGSMYGRRPARTGVRLLGWLLARDLQGFQAHGRAPMTAGKKFGKRLGRERWVSALHDALDAGAGPFGKDLVTVEEIGEWLRMRRFVVSAAALREWLKGQRFSALSRRRVPGSGGGEGVKAAVWVLRNEARWMGASRPGGGSGVDGGESFETPRQRAERAAQGIQVRIGKAEAQAPSAKNVLQLRGVPGRSAGPVDKQADKAEAQMERERPVLGA